MVNLDEEKKQETYTFGDLKKDACIFFSIPLQFFKYHSIINEKNEVFSKRYLVWEFHSEVFEKKKRNLEWEKIELIDRMSIFFNRKTNLNDFHSDKVIDFEKKVIEDKKTYINSNNRIFVSDLENYFMFYLKIEAFFNLFKSTNLEEKLIKERHNARVQKWRENWRQEAIKLDLDTEDRVAREVEHQNLEDLNLKEKLKGVKSEKSKKIIYNPYHLYKLRLLNFINFYFTILIAGFIFVYYFQRDKTNKLLSTNIDSVIKEYFFYNPNYKNFYYSAYKERDVSKFKNSMLNKISLGVFVDILLGNLIAPKTLNLNKKSSSFSYKFTQDLFDKDNPYRHFRGIVFDFQSITGEKKSYDVFDILGKNNTSLSYGPYTEIRQSNNPRKFDYMKYIPLNESRMHESFKFDNLIKEELLICNNCFTNKEIIFDNNIPNNSTTKGDLYTYKFGGYSFMFHPNYLTKSDYYNLLNTLRVFFTKEDLRLFTIFFDIYLDTFDIYYRTKISFEFNEVAGISAHVFTRFVPVNTNIDPFYSIINYILISFIIIIFLKAIFNIIVSNMISKESRGSNYLHYYDIIISVIFAILEFNFYLITLR